MSSNPSGPEWLAERAVEANDLELELDGESSQLMDEAMRLLPEQSPHEIVRRALREMVERYRFLNWVKSKEKDRTGTA